MEKGERDQRAYALAKDYLLSFSALGVTPELLEHYLNPGVPALRPKTIPGIYRRLLLSAQERAMATRVIRAVLGGIDELAPVLCDFRPRAIVRKYGEDWRPVLDDIQRELHPKGKIRRGPRSILPFFCRTITSAASFLAQFTSSDEFYAWVDIFDRDERARPALAMLLSLEIEGFGFALGCNFLKDLGYFNFGKPDVQLKTIFKGLGLASQNAGDYEVFKAIARVARHQGVSPYNVDKLFWLVGSGYFHDHSRIGARGRIGANREKFIQQASARLGARNASGGLAR